jgi:hypothetical protein
MPTPWRSAEGNTGHTAIARCVWISRGQRPRACTQAPCMGTGSQFDAQPAPFALHSITEELIMGQTERAKKVAALRRRHSASIPENLNRQRWLDFLIRETSRFDPGVGADKCCQRNRERSGVARERFFPFSASYSAKEKFRTHLPGQYAA